MDLSFRALFAHQNGRPYNITTTFDGRDLINGGMHMAVDVGNFGMDDPILSPINGKARGLYNFDTAIGIEYDLGNGWTLQLWHLNATLAFGLSLVPGKSSQGQWVDVVRGQVCGRTGNSGAKVNGQPMPAHTHIELEKAGKRYDVAPYLRGLAFNPEDDMRYPGPNVPFLLADIGPGNNLRSSASLDPSAIALYLDPKQFPAPIQVGVFSYVAGASWNGSTVWAWIGYDGTTYLVHSKLLSNVRATDHLPVKGGYTADDLTAARKATADKANAQMDAWTAARPRIVP